MFSPEKLKEWFHDDAGDNIPDRHAFDCAYGSFEEMHATLGEKVSK